MIGAPGVLVRGDLPVAFVDFGGMARTLGLQQRQSASASMSRGVSTETK